MAKSKRARICFVPGCRNVIAGDKTEFFCPKHIAQMERALRAKKTKSA